MTRQSMYLLAVKKNNSQKVKELLSTKFKDVRMDETIDVIVNGTPLSEEITSNLSTIIDNVIEEFKKLDKKGTVIESTLGASVDFIDVPIDGFGTLLGVTSILDGAGLKHFTDWKDMTPIYAFIYKSVCDKIVTKYSELNVPEITNSSVLNEIVIRSLELSMRFLQTQNL